MRRDELMKPDAFSDAILVVVGAAILLVLGSTAFLAMAH
jgi:hypothetical protein